MLDGEEKPSYSVVQSLLRLGKKYEVDDLYKWALRRLEAFFPDTLDAWNAAASDPPFRYEKADLISMAKLTRELELTNLYPRALYKCCVRPRRSIIEGLVNTRGDRIQLDAEDQIACIDIIRFLTASRAAMAARIAGLDLPSPECMSPEDCSISHDALRQIVEHGDIMDHVELTESLVHWRARVDPTGKTSVQ